MARAAADSLFELWRINKKWLCLRADNWVLEWLPLSFSSSRASLGRPRRGGAEGAAVGVNDLRYTENERTEGGTAGGRGTGEVGC